MFRYLKNSIAALLIVVAAQTASAFSLLGPRTSWMDTAKDYGYLGGGPMNIGEEFRWNTPVVTYGFDESFLNYFGEEGVKAIEEAIQLINDLPPMSDVDLSQYPLNTRRRNYRAGALGLLDIKSVSLYMMMNELCLAQPEEYVWCLRNDYHDSSNPYRPYLTVIKRNFDPETWEPTSYINGTLYTYQIFHYDPPHQAFAQKYAPDPLAFTYSTVAGGYIQTGDFYSGLTRDDVGGFRYIYRFNNYNVEDVVSNTTYSVNQALVQTGGGAYTPVGTTNLIPGAVPGGTPWYPINYTNIVYGNTNTAGLTNATVVAGNTNINLIGLRPGQDKIRLFRVLYDSYLGQLSAPITNRYIDMVISNNVVRQQVLERVITRPDIVFAAADLGVDDLGYPFDFGVTYNGSSTANNFGFITFDGINGNTPLDGPGIRTFPIELSFNKIGPWYYNGPGFLTELSGQTYYTWGHFDGTTNAPIVFPKGSSIRELEKKVLGY